MIMRRIPSVTDKQVMYFFGLNTLFADMLIAMILSDKAADTCLHMIGWLWSGTGWREEISRRLCSLTPGHLTD